MALSEDQKAMLRLLAQRGEQGYEDLSALLGISVDEVHARAQKAAAELEAEGIPAPAIPPPPAGAGAGSKRPAEPRPPRQPEPAAAPAPVRREPAPKPPAPKPAAPKPPPPPRSGFELPRGRGARAAVAASALAVVAFVLILLLSGGEGSDDASPDGSSGQTAREAARAAAEANPNLTQAVLSPVDGGDAEGRAIFGRIRKNVILQVQAEGLEPSPPGSAYTVWLYKSPQLALRVGSVKVAESGGIATQLPLPTELLAYIAGGAFDQIDVSLTSNAAYRAEIAKAKKEERLPAYTGEDVLRGPITGPAIEAASKARE